MKSWKTTLGGALAAAGVMLAGAPMTLSACNVALGDRFFAGCIMVGFLLQVVGLLVNGVYARDNDVPSAAVPAAARTANELKSRDSGVLPLP